MGIFSGIRNKFMFSEIIDKGAGFALGKYRDDNKRGYALLHNDKIVQDAVIDCTDNMQKGTEGQSAYIITIDENSCYSVFAMNGERVDFDTVKGDGYVPFKASETNNPDLVAKRGPDGEIIITLPSTNKFILYPRFAVSGIFSEIGEPNKYGERKVQTSPTSDYYYIDERGFKCSPNFTYESTPDPQGNTILALSGVAGSSYVIANKNHEIISKPFTYIKKYMTSYIATNYFDETFFIDKTGKKLSPVFVGDVLFLRSGKKLIELPRENKGPVEFTLLDDKYKPIYENFTNVQIAQKPVIVTAECKDGEYVVFGEKAIPYPVNADVARLVMNKVQDKRMSPLYIDKVVDSGTDVLPTLTAFEQVIDENLEMNPDNAVLVALKQNLRSKFIELIQRASSERLRKSEKTLEAIRARQAELDRAELEASARRRNASNLKNKAKNVSVDEDDSESGR